MDSLSCLVTVRDERKEWSTTCLDRWHELVQVLLISLGYLDRVAKVARYFGKEVLLDLRGPVNKLTSIHHELLPLFFEVLLAGDPLAPNVQRALDAIVQGGRIIEHDLDLADLVIGIQLQDLDVALEMK